MRNLDTLAAQTAQQIIRTAHGTCAKAEIENLATKTLGVLQENGVYAATLFLFSRTGPDAKVAPFVRKELLKLTEEEIIKSEANSSEPDDVLKYISEQVASDLDTLLLTKEVWEQCLIYLRYGAKALPEGGMK